MNRFTGSVQYTYLANGLAFASHSVRFYFDDECEGEYIEIQRGQLSNFASVPKIFIWLFKPDGNDIKMPAFFHDGLISEFGQQLWILEDNKNGNPIRVRIPDWNESALWFRKMIQIRQRATRNKKPKWLKFLLAGVDFLFRWSCWFAVVVHGQFK